MPVQVSYPGVYIQEVPSGVRTITGVSTSIALFIGMTQRGPIDTAVNLLSFADYERSFGSDTTVSETTDQVRQFFLNGGRQAYVIRIAANEQAAAADLHNEAGAVVLRITAAEAGRIGESIRVEVNYATAQPEATFNLVVSREVIDATGAPTLLETETISDLSMNPNAARFVDTTVEQGSRLIRAAVQPTAPAAFAGYSMSGRAEADSSGALNAESPTRATSAPSDQRRPGSVYPGEARPARWARSTISRPPSTPPLRQSADGFGAGGRSSRGRRRSAADPQCSRWRPGPDTARHGNDIAGPMHLGTTSDGLEVDGHAARRPARPACSPAWATSTAPGYLARPLCRAFSGGPGNLPDLTLTTSQRADTITFSGFTRPTFWENVPAAGTTLRNARRALDCDRSRSAIPPTSIGRRPSGLRLVLNPTFPSSPNRRAWPSLTTGTYDIANAGNGYLGRSANVRRAPLALCHSLRLRHRGDSRPRRRQAAPQTTRTLTDRFARIDLFNLLILPRVLSDGSGAASRTPNAPALGAGQRLLPRRARLSAHRPADAWTSAQNATAPTIANLRIGVVGDHAMVAWPRLRIPDPVGGQLRTLDPAGFPRWRRRPHRRLARRLEGARGARGDLLGVRGVPMRHLRPGERAAQSAGDQRYPAVPQRHRHLGLAHAGRLRQFGRDDYKYVPVRRFALFLEESLYRGLQFAVFEPNDEPLWAQIRLAAGAFMNNLFRRGAFQGQNASEAYFVKCDSETTTQNDINLGIVNVVVGFAPLKPAEFIVITVRQLAGQVQT